MQEVGRGLCSLFVVALGMAASAAEERGADTSWSWDLSPTLVRALEVVQLGKVIVGYIIPTTAKNFFPMSSLNLPCSTQTWYYPEVEY